MTPHTVIEIKQGLQTAAAALQNYCVSLGEEDFFHQPSGKWSPAQQVKHLIVSANMSRLAFSLPKFIVRMIAGKPNRPSRTYDELVAKYTWRLSQGGRASGRFVPKPIPATVGKEKLLKQLTKAMDRFTTAVSKHDKEPVLDQYLVPHPLLGKITLRELGFFTIHHTYHHLASIQAMTDK
jgi:DinB superfamily